MSQRTQGEINFGDWVFAVEQESVPWERQSSIDIIKELRKRGQYTPDFDKIRQFKSTIVFVYDDFKKTKPYHSLLLDSYYLGDARTCSDSFAMKGSSYPVAFKNNNHNHERGNIKGEAYAVTPETLMRMDQIKSNRCMFNREKRNVFLLDQEFPGKKKTSPSVQAWMYIGNEGFWKGQTLDLCPSSLPINGKTKNKVYCYY